MSKIDPQKPFQIKVSGKWHKGLGINYHTYEPTISYLHKNSTSYEMNGVGGKIDSEVSGYPLVEVEDFRNVR